MPGLLERRIVERMVSQSINDIEFATAAARALRDDPGRTHSAADYRAVLGRLEVARRALANAATRLGLEV